MEKHAIIIAGGGPTGLTLAAELKLAGVDVAVVERRADRELVGARAGGLHARTIEAFDQRGIAERFLTQGQTAQIAGFAWIRLDMADFPSRHPYGLALRQKHIERILAEWASELEVRVYPGREVAGLKQDAGGVDVMLSDGSSLRADYLVGCDGGRSTVRKAAGIGFPGTDATISNLLAEVKMTGEPPWGLRRDAHGIHSLAKGEDGVSVGVMLTEPDTGRTGEPTVEDLREAMKAAYGSDFGMHDPSWISRFTDMARQAETYRKGRVLLAGDAAHIHYPTGGQGLNIGVQDAMNLGWKLAQVVKGISPEALLDTYHAERHPVAARVLRDTRAQVALLRTDGHTDALREIMADLLKLDGPRKAIAGMMSGLDVRYGTGQGHPLVGRRMPDLEVTGANGTMRVFSLLHKARPLLLNLGAPGFDVGEWADRVAVVDARYDGTWELPVLGAVEGPTAVLIRPDGYVAWVEDQSGQGLPEALTTWFGPAAA